MNNLTLDQKRTIDSMDVNTKAKLQKNSFSFVVKGSIFERIIEFANSVPEFRRSKKGNFRHKLSDIIILIILARMSGCVARADIIEYGTHNINRFQSMRMLKNGVPSEATLYRVENGLNEQMFAEKMAEFSAPFNKELVKADEPMEIICVDGKAMCGTVLENGRNPDIVSAYSFSTGITLATEACQEKSNEIKAVPLLLEKLDIRGKLVTADAMSMQKGIIDLIRSKEGYFLIELKANQRTLRYGVEDRIKNATPMFTYTSEPELGHGRIETRTYNIYEGLPLIADKEKWGGNLTVVESVSHTIRKSTGAETSETRLYLTNLPTHTPWIGIAVRNHWSIESMHWGLDCNLKQDAIKRKSARAARNLDTFQRIVFSIFSIWRGRRKKRSDKSKGTAELMRKVSRSMTALMRFLSQK